MDSESAGADPWLDTLSTELRGLQRRLDRVVELAETSGPTDSLADALRDLSIAARGVGESVGRRLGRTSRQMRDDLPGARVLLVSDDDDARAVLAMGLGLDGIEVIEAGHTDDALAICADDDRIDIVVTDLHVPARGGIGLLEALREVAAHRDTPVVIHTHDPATHAAEAALEAGAADFIRKPVPPDELAARLRHVVTTSRRQQQATEAVQRLESLADTDELTGLPNRRALAGSYEATSGDVALLLVDIDHFKQVNDRHGHDVGDDVLRRVADVLRTEKRSNDVAGRWGGDEFMVVARDLDRGGLDQLAHRLVAAVREHPGVSVGLRATVSIGAALGAPGMTAQELFERADRALYDAKQAGRDRAVTAP